MTLVVPRRALAARQRVMATNVTGAFLHSREAAKVMIPNKKGAIVNIASYASYFAFPTIAAYCAS